MENLQRSRLPTLNAGEGRVVDERTEVADLDYDVAKTYVLIALFRSESDLGPKQS
jgi:hypothetical protein